MLRELAQMGMRVARVMEQQALGEETAAPKVADPVLALERMAKMVRMTLALEARLDGLLRTRERKPHAIRIWRAALKGFPPPKDKPETAHRIVEKLIETEADPDEIAELMRELAGTIGSGADGEPGLSDETVILIKARMLGMRPEEYLAAERRLAMQVAAAATAQAGSGPPEPPRRQAPDPAPRPERPEPPADPPPEPEGKLPVRRTPRPAVAGRAGWFHVEMCGTSRSGGLKPALRRRTLSPRRCPGPPRQAAQSRMTLPLLPDMAAAKPASNESAGKRWVTIGAVEAARASPTILYHVSNISRP